MNVNSSIGFIQGTTQRWIARSAPGELRLSFNNSALKGKNLRLFRFRVKSLVFTLCITAVFTVSASGLTPQADKSTHKTERARTAPKAIVPLTSFDFGDVYTGEVISQLFVIKNEGNAELLITDFKADCGCTVVRGDKKVAPGKQSTAEVEVQTISQSGPINKYATLQTNDPDRPTIVLTIMANVLKGSPRRRGKFIGPLFLSPDSQLALFAAAGKKARAELSVTADRDPVNVVRVETGTTQFVSRLEVIEPGKLYKVVVESTEIDTGGLYIDQLRVITDSPALPAFNVELVLRVYPKN